MSTRTNILVMHGRSRVYIYRHHDGYPGGTGADLVEKLRAAEGSAEKFLVALLTDQYEATSYCGPRPIYEITSELHGDIDYIYAVSVGGTDPQIGVIRRPPGEDPDLVLRQLSQRSVAEFVKVVNADRRQMNQRLEQLKVSNPGSVYADCDPYPMLEEAA